MFALAVACIAHGGMAEAHPFGMSSVNRYLGVECTERGGLHIAWLLDFAELPAARELARLDRDGDGAVTPVERDAYLDALVPGVLAQWTIERNGERVVPRLVHRSIEAPEGQSGLSTLRILGELTVDPMPQPTPNVTVHVIDHSYSDRQGFRDLRADDTDAARLVSAPAEIPVSAPDGTTLRRVDEATFVFALRHATVVPAPVVSTLPTRTVWWVLASAVGWLLALVLGLARRDLDPRARIVVAIGFAIAASALPPDHTRALAGLGACAFVTALAVRPRPAWLARRLAIALLWALGFAAVRVFASPSPHAIDPALRLAARIAIALVALLPLSATTTLTTLADALAGLGLPSLFVDTTVTTARGVQILRDESERVARARRLRAPDAGPITRLTLFGSLASTVLERGLQRADRAHLAMSLRGFDGHAPSSSRRTPRALDIAALAVALATLAAITRIP